MAWDVDVDADNISHRQQTYGLVVLVCHWMYCVCLVHHAIVALGRPLRQSEEKVVRHTHKTEPGPVKLCAGPV